MFTVRFPSGVSIQYNDAAYASRGSGYTDIYEKKDGRWIAQVPNDCVIEAVAPCRIYNPTDRTAEYAERLGRIEKELRSLKRRIPTPKRKTP